MAIFDFDCLRQDVVLRHNVIDLLDLLLLQLLTLSLAARDVASAQSRLGLPIQSNAGSALRLGDVPH